MSEPVLSRVHISPYADVMFLATVTGAPDVVAPSGRTVWVMGVEVRYHFDFSTSRWSHAVKVMGRRIGRDGTPGTSPSNVVFGHEDEMPEWLARIVTRERPAFILPDMRTRNA